MSCCVQPLLRRGNPLCKETVCARPHSTSRTVFSSPYCGWTITPHVCACASYSLVVNCYPQRVRARPLAKPPVRLKDAARTNGDSRSWQKDQGNRCEGMQRTDAGESMSWLPVFACLTWQRGQAGVDAVNREIETKQATFRRKMDALVQKVAQWEALLTSATKVLPGCRSFVCALCVSLSSLHTRNRTEQDRI